MSIMSKWNTSLNDAVARFKRDERGQFAILFAVTSIALTMMSGVALDTARLYSAKSKLDNAVDAAILATTRDLTSGAISEKDAEEAVSNFLFSNIDANGSTGSVVKIDDINVDSTNKTVKIDAHLMLPMTLTAIAGINELKVATTSMAEYNDDRVEIAMALDVTGSMGNDLPSGQTRMEALKDAAANAIDILIPDTTVGQSRVRVGLVPYSASVNVTPVLDDIEYTGVSQGCVVERTVSKPYANNFASNNHPVNGLNRNVGTSGCPSNEIVALTSNAGTLRDNIAALGTSGYTAGHVGIAWTQYMLSATWNTAWPGDLQTGSDAAPSTDTKTKKYAIIMTDGEFNTFLSNGHGGGNGVDESRTYAKRICDRMKTGKIKIFSINFAGGSEAEALMRNCASPDTSSEQFFYSANDGEQLKKAFEAIAIAIKKLRLVS